MDGASQHLVRGRSGRNGEPPRGAAGSLFRFQKGMEAGRAESKPHLAAMRRQLLAWYDRNKRDLPWRRRCGYAYAQWVAEIMLQQTRVETVAAYYDRFLVRFPTVEALARASHESVLKHWEGLGYYRRALHLHQAAKLLAAERRSIPSSAEELRRLPGIGDYTSAAIASIAFNEAVAAVDGNVTRVISRLFTVRQNVREPPGKASVAELASALLSHPRPGDFNQALMDLGSGICTPRQPDCPRCPLRRYCKAFIAGTAACYPISGAKRAPTDQVLVTALFTRDGSVLMRRRAIGGLWSGLWEPPSLPVVAGRLLDGITNLALQESVDLVAKPRSVGATRHQLTHRSLTFRVYSCEVVAGGAWLRRKDRRWCTPSQLAALAISTAHRKVLAHLRPLEVRE